MSNVIKSPESLVKKLPIKYIEPLSRRAFGDFNDTLKRRIKHWRSGNMRDRIMRLKIQKAAEQLIEEVSAN